MKAVCIYCGRGYRRAEGGPLVCKKCEPTASMVHRNPNLFTNGAAGVEARRSELAAKKARKAGHARP